MRYGVIQDLTPAEVKEAFSEPILCERCGKHATPYWFCRFTERLVVWAKCYQCKRDSYRNLPREG